MIAAANKAGIAVQVGSQGRSQPEAYLAHRYLANGNIGRSHTGRLLPLSQSHGRVCARQRIRRPSWTGNSGSARSAGGRTIAATATARFGG